jgi:FixJ family two-component response regulator
MEILEHPNRIGSRSSVVIITGHDSFRARRESLALGAKAFFAKPVDGNELIDAVRRSSNVSRQC